MIILSSLSAYALLKFFASFFPRAYVPTLSASLCSYYAQTARKRKNHARNKPSRKAQSSQFRTANTQCRLPPRHAALHELSGKLQRKLKSRAAKIISLLGCVSVCHFFHFTPSSRHLRCAPTLPSSASSANISLASFLSFFTKKPFS